MPTPVLATDPVDYAEVDSSHTNSATLPLAVALNGYGTQFFESDEANAIFGNAAEWKRWLDQTRLPPEQALGEINCRTSAFGFSYTTDPGFTQTLAVDSAYVVSGKFVSLTVARVTQVGLYHEFTFTASKATHFHVAPSGEIQHEEVGIAVPPTSPPGFVYLHTVLTDGAGVSGQQAGTAFEVRRVLHSILEEVSGGLLINSTAPTIDIVNLIMDRDGGSDQDIVFQTDADPTLGWVLRHETGGKLLIYEQVAGVPTLALDMGTALTTPATFSRPAKIVSPALTGGLEALRVESSDDLGPGSHFVSKRTAALTLEATGPGGAPLVMVPRATPVGGNPVGTVVLSNTADGDLYVKDNNSNVRRAWMTQAGQILASTYTLANLNNQAAGVVIATINVAFVTGRRYLIRARSRYGRFTGSTRDVQFTTTINAVNVAFSATTCLCFQAGGATQIEGGYTDEAEYVAAATATYTVQILAAPVNGAGNFNVSNRGIVVLGAFD